MYVSMYINVDIHNTYEYINTYMYIYTDIILKHITSCPQVEGKEED
jgi:hypothetical protein